MTSSPSHQLTAPITRILAVDDLLGKVYASCSSPSDKQAFRHATATCYRSPSINAKLSSYEAEYRSQAEDTIAALAAFPRHAQLKELIISTPDPSHSELFKRLLLNDDAVSSRASATLRSVVKLRLVGYPQLGSFDGLAVAHLFPRLLDPTSHSSLDLEFCEAPEDPFMAIVAGQVKPTTLSLCCHSGMSLQPLARMQQLQCLILDGPTQELHSLSKVLGHLPQLHTLSLKSLERGSPVNLQIVSSSLRTIDLGCVSTSMPELRHADLPALQQVCLSGIDLSSFGDTLPGASSLVSELSKLSSTGTLKLSASVNTDGFMFKSNDGWSQEDQQAVFSTVLAPLRPFLATVTKLIVSKLGACEQFVLSSLADVFSNLVWLEFTQGAYIEDPVEVWPLLSLPKLQFIAIRFQFAPPKDLLAALRQVADEGRSLRLEAKVLDNYEQDDDWYDRMTFLADQVRNPRLKLLGPSVELVVMRG